MNPIRFDAASFSGISPKLNRSLASHGFSRQAHNLDLGSGTLRGLRAPRKISNATGERLFVAGCCPLLGDCSTSWAIPMPSSDRVYRVHGGQLQVATTDVACTGKWWDLGFERMLPAPAIKTTDFDGVQVQIDVDRQVEETYAVYRVIDRWGNPSAPSQPSPVALAVNGANVIVEGLPTAYPDRWSGATVEVYLARSGAIGNVEESDGDVGLFRYGEVPIGNRSISIYFGTPGEELDSEDYEPAPPNLRDLVAWQDGQMAALSGAGMRFCERGAVSNWSSAYELAFFSYPLRLVAGRHTAYVLTRGQPAIIKLQHGCDQPFCHAAEHIQRSLPIIATDSAVVIDERVYYASSEGLVRIGPDGSVAIVSDPYFGPIEWDSILPSTMRAGRWRSHYVFVTDAGAWMLDTQADPRTALMSVDLDARSFSAGELGDLHFINDTGVYQWAAGEHDMPWRWSSPVVMLPHWTALWGYRVLATWPGVRARVLTGDHTILVGDADIVADEEIIDGGVRVLPAGHSCMALAVELEGTGEVSAVLVGPHSEDLTV